MNIENNCIRDENFESIISHAYANFIVRKIILSTKKLMFAVQIKVFHVQFKFRLLKIRKQREKFKKTFRLVDDERENTLSKSINFTKLSIEFLIILKILQQFDQLV